MFPQSIINMLTLNNFLKAEHVEWSKNWLGSTGYIDRVKSKDLKNTISYGIDGHQRWFIFIKIHKKNYDIDTDLLENETDAVLTIFRRYTDADKVVCIDSFGYNALIESQCVVGKELSEKINIFLSNKYQCFEKTECYGKSEIFLI